MTVKELIRELQNVPEDAIVLADHHFHGLYEVVEGIEYNDPQNVIYFWGNEIYDPEDCRNDIPEDIDENNCEIYEAYPADEMW